MGVVLRAPFPRRRRRWPQVARNGFRYLFLGAWRNWLRNLTSTMPALASMTLLLVLSGLVGMAAFALERAAASQTASAAVLHVYLRDDATPQAVAALKARLKANRDVVSVGYTSKAQALKQAESRPGLPQLANAAGTNPFPASLDLRLRSVADVGAVAAMAARSPATDPLTPTSYNPGTYRRIQTVMSVVEVLGGAFLVLMGFVAVAVTANSIRAAILARQSEVRIMQLVGAPRWMVRGPFVVEGALTGAVAGAVAGLVTLVVWGIGIAAGASAFVRFAPGVTVGVTALAALVILVGGFVLGTVASLISVHRELETT